MFKSPMVRPLLSVFPAAEAHLPAGFRYPVGGAGAGAPSACRGR